MKKILFILPFILLFGCIDKQLKNDGCELIIVPVSFEDNSSFDLSNISKEIFYVKLVTEDSCLVGNIDKMYYINDHIVVGSDKNTLLFFNKDGSFDHKFFRQGNGPGEYLRISDFYIDKLNNEIYVLDTRKKQLLQYDWYGNFVGMTNLNSWFIGLQSYNDSVSIMYSGNQISADNEYKLSLYNTNSHIIFDRFYPVSSEKSKYLHVHSANNFSKYDDEVLFCELYNDTVYSVSSSGCIPRYYLDFGNDKVPSSLYDKPYNNIMEFHNEFFKHDFSYGINSLANLPNGFIASCFIQKQKYFVYYDAYSQISNTFKKISDKRNLNDKIIDVVEHKVEFYSNNGYLLMLADNEFYMQVDNSVLSEKWGGVKYDDNPIVVVCNLDILR